jgi:hypothetical protein
MGAVWGQVHVWLLTRTPLSIVGDQLTACVDLDPPVVVLVEVRLWLTFVRYPLCETHFGDRSAHLVCCSILNRAATSAPI